MGCAFCGEGLEMRWSDLGETRDIAPLEKKAEMVLKAPEMVFNERKGR